MVVNNLAIYTDGACLGNPGPGGWGAVILDGQEKRVLHGHEADTTNNRMEIYAVIRGLQDVPKDVGVTLYSDSTYVINTMTKGWKRNKNQDLWDVLDEEVRGRRIVWKWVKGHSGDPLNEEADKLAHGEATGILKKDKLMESKAKKKDKFLTHIDDTGAAQMVDVFVPVVSRAARYTDHFVSFIQQQLSKIGPILPGHTCYQCGLLVSSHRHRSLLGLR